MLVSGIDYEVGVTFPEAIKKKIAYKMEKTWETKRKGGREQMETPLLRQKDQQKA